MAASSASPGIDLLKSTQMTSLPGLKWSGSFPFPYPPFALHDLAPAFSLTLPPVPLLACSVPHFTGFLSPLLPSLFGWNILPLVSRGCFLFIIQLLTQYLLPKENPSDVCLMLQAPSSSPHLKLSYLLICLLFVFPS